jgi:hypothetical protein
MHCQMPTILFQKSGIYRNGTVWLLDRSRFQREEQLTHLEVLAMQTYHSAQILLNLYAPVDGQKGMEGMERLRQHREHEVNHL